MPSNPMSCVTWDKSVNLSGLLFEYLCQEAILEWSTISECLTQSLITLVLKEGLPLAQPKSLNDLNCTDRK